MVIDGVKIEIEIHPTLGGTPAKCRIEIPRKYAIVKLAQDLLSGQPTEVIFFTMLHEIAHAVLNTGNEFACDAWAFKQYIKAGHRLDTAVFAISNQLDPTNNAEHAERTRRQFYRAKHAAFLSGKISWRKFIKLKI